MKPTNLIIIMCGLLTLGSACKKDENNSPVGKMLQAGKWQVSASEIIKYMDREALTIIATGGRANKMTFSNFTPMARLYQMKTLINARKTTRKINSSGTCRIMIPG